MLRFRRILSATAFIGFLVGVSGCAGIGVNIGSGAKGATNVTGVLIQTLTGSNQILVNATGCLTVQAVATTSGTPNGVASVQGAVWNTNGPGTVPIALFEADCTHPYGGEPQQVVGVQLFSVRIGCAAADSRQLLASSGTATINATVQGVKGTNTVTVFF